MCVFTKMRRGFDYHGSNFLVKSKSIIIEQLSEQKENVSFFSLQSTGPHFSKLSSLNSVPLTFDTVIFDQNGSCLL